MNTFRFRAMNTDIALLAPETGSSFEQAAALVYSTFAEVERCLSRFRPDSELSALNRSSGEPFHASPLLFRAVSLALEAARTTDGVFDPSILSALEGAGYNRSFERLSPSTGGVALAEPVALPDYRRISCDPATTTIRLAEGIRIDLGGIGKGLAVDLALEATKNLSSRCINAGGDIAARGGPHGQEGWSVGLEDTGDARKTSIVLRDAALATSTVTKRRWMADGGGAHHLIDPRTGRPSASPLRTVTVIAVTCVRADVAAKTALLLGEQGLDFLEQKGLYGFGVRRDGTTFRTSGWPV